MKNYFTNKVRKKYTAIKRVVSAMLVMSLLALCLIGCDKEDTNESTASKDEDKKIQIGMCFDSFVIERWQRDRDVFVSMAKELGAEVNIQNANGDVDEQKKQVEYLIKKNMDVIVIICIDSSSLKDSIKKAQEEGIKVIAYDRLISDADVDFYITFDNEMVGEMMGEVLVDNGLVGGRVLMICGSPTDNNVPMVEAGFERVMEEAGNEIVDKIYADGWRAEVASEYVYANLANVIKSDAIMCGNDDLASRTVYALSEKRLAGSKMVVGQDADLEACQRIVEGTQLMTVYKPIEKLAQKAAECAVKMAKGEELTDSEYSIGVMNDGSYNVPCLKIEPISVTADNMDEVIIKSGFHLKEDVYLNVPGKMPD